MDKLYEYIGYTVKEIRESYGFTQEKMAELLGLSRASIANIETGRHGIRIETMYLLAITFDEPIARFLPPYEQLEAWEPPVKRIQGKRGRPRIHPVGDEAVRQRTTVRNKGLTCAAPVSCNQAAQTKGYCYKHYQWYIKHGNSFEGYKPHVAGKVCSIPGCGGKTVGRGKCMRHYKQEQRANGGWLTPT